MAKRIYPVEFRVEFSGDAQLMEWSGTVSAMSRENAIAIAAARAAGEGVYIGPSTHTRVEQTGQD